MTSRTNEMLLLAAPAAVLLAATAQAIAVDCTWIADDGHWDVATNWDCGVVPGTGDSATIDTPGVTITVPELTIVDTLELTAATLEILDELKTLDFHFESGTLGGGGVLQTDTLMMDGPSRTLDGGTTLVLMAQGAWLSGSIGISSGAEIVVAGTAELELSSGAGFGTLSGVQTAFLVIEEGGTFRRTGSGTSLFNSMRVVNHGSFIVGNAPSEDSGPAVAFQSQNGFPHTGRFEVLDDGTLHFQARSDHTDDAELVGTGVVQFSGSGAHTFEGGGYDFDGLTQPLPGGAIVFQNGTNASTGSLSIANAVQIRGQAGTPPQGMNPTFTVHGSLVTEGNQVRFQHNLHIHALDGFDVSTALLQLETNAVLFNHGEGNLAYGSEFRLGGAGNSANRTTLHNLPGATLNVLTNGLIRSASGASARGGIILNEGVINIDADPDDEGLDALRVNGQRIVNRGEIKTVSGSWEFNNPFAALLNDGGAISTTPVRFLDGASLGGTGSFNGSVILEGGRLRTAEPDADILPMDEPVVADLVIANELTMDADSGVAARLFSDEGPGVGHDRYSVLGSASLDGTLLLSKDEAFAGSACETFTVLTSNSDFIGGFHTVDVLDDANLAPLFDDDSVSMVVPDGQSGVLGDFNCDGVVDGADLGLLLQNWGPCADCDDCIFDLTGDCNVGGADLGILLQNWG